MSEEKRISETLYNDDINNNKDNSDISNNNIKLKLP